MNRNDTDAVQDYLLALRERIAAALGELERGLEIRKDPWQKPRLGTGESWALRGEEVFEKGGINFSRVRGEGLPPAATSQRPQLAGASFEAVGLSLILHPHNPYVPTVHTNLRFFQAAKEGTTAAWWFGGGFDLTPCYGFEEDARHWHRTARAACLPFGAEVYPRCKRWCDEYFHIRHRGEPRGIGGLFFDDLHEWGFERCFAFARSVGDHFLPAYLPIAERRRDTPYGERERQFQLYRRGRYAEFNLVYDRGTLFGLQSGGRAESILISLPPLVRWIYDWQPEAGSPEARLYTDFLRPRDWLSAIPAKAGIQRK